MKSVSKPRSVVVAVLRFFLRRCRRKRGGESGHRRVRIFAGTAMEPAKSAEVTGLLKAWSSGDEAALDRLTAIVHGELHRIARRYMRNERPGNTLQATALVNEVYLRLVDVKNVGWQHRAQFFAISAQIMRNILVDAARARGAHKRGGAAVKVNVDETLLFVTRARRFHSGAG